MHWWFCECAGCQCLLDKFDRLPELFLLDVVEQHEFDCDARGHECAAGKDWVLAVGGVGHDLHAGLGDCEVEFEVCCEVDFHDPRDALILESIYRTGVCVVDNNVCASGFGYFSFVVIAHSCKYTSTRPLCELHCCATYRTRSPSHEN